MHNMHFFLPIPDTQMTLMICRLNELLKIRHYSWTFISRDEIVQFYRQKCDSKIFLLLAAQDIQPLSKENLPHL